MAKYVNKKVYTDHALMDEVIYQCKIILAGIVLKNNVLADKYETSESIEESDYFMACKNGTMEFGFFPFTLSYFLNCGLGYDLTLSKKFAIDRNLVPIEDRDALMQYSIQRYIDEYEEKNNYYRALNGKPFYGTNEYDILIDPNDPLLDPRMIENYTLNYDAPIHKWSDKDIELLKLLGIIDREIEDHSDDPIHYRYLKYLGTRKIDPYNARSAAEWDILFIPNAENLVRSRFIEIYHINRDIYMKRTYQLAYSWMSDHYEEMIMLMILCQTFSDIIAELPEWYIRRDIFDLRSCKYFLESQGVKFFNEILLKYQIKLVKNLNRLIKYKSTDKNIKDILEIFAVDGTVVYKYYLIKNYDVGNEPYIAEYSCDCGALRGIDNRGKICEECNTECRYVRGDVFKDKYGRLFNMEFLKVPIGESFDQYIRDNKNLQDYDTITELDRFWDGDLDHSTVKEMHADKLAGTIKAQEDIREDYQGDNIEGTKYMFLEYEINISKFQFQLCYFLGLLLNRKTNIEDIMVDVPTISTTNMYSIVDLIILLICLTGPYNSGKPTLIHIPFFPEDPGEWVMDDIYDFGEQGVDDIYYDPSTGGEKYDFGLNYILDPTLPTHLYDFNEERAGSNSGSGSGSGSSSSSSGGSSSGTSGDVPYTPPSHHIDVNYNNKKDDKYYWLRDMYPEIWTFNKWKIYGFNLEVDLDKLAEDIGMNHSTFGFKDSYKLSDFGVEEFMNETIFVDVAPATAIEKVYTLYETNKKCYDNIIYFLTGYITDENSEYQCQDPQDKKKYHPPCQNKDQEMVANYVFSSLFLTNFDMDFYRLKSGDIATYYYEILKERSYALYKYYMDLTSEPDPDAMKDSIRTVLADIVATLESFIGHKTELNFLFSFVPTSSVEAIIKYISLVIDFFKSWKVYFLDPAVTYVVDNRKDDADRFVDLIGELKYNYVKHEPVTPRDNIVIAIQRFLEEEDVSFNKEIMEIFGYYDNDPLFDNVYDGYTPVLSPSAYLIANGGIEKMVTVANDRARYALTTSDVQNGSIVKVTSTNKSYFVIDDTKLNNAKGYSLYTPYIINTHIPFVMIDGCNAASGMTNRGIFTFDGDNPSDEHIEVIDIDGQDITDPYDVYDLSFNPVGYSINGGPAGAQVSAAQVRSSWYHSIRTSITRTLVISNDVIIAPADKPYNGNKLRIVSNGLYLGDGIANHASKADYDELLSYMDHYIDEELIPLGVNYLELIRLFESQTHLNSQINKTVKTELYVIDIFANELTDFEFTGKIKKYINDIINTKLYDWWNENDPVNIWGTF